MGHSFRTRTQHAGKARHRAAVRQQARAKSNQRAYPSTSITSAQLEGFSLYNGLPALYVALTPSAKILAINRFGAQLLGMAQAKAIGKDVIAWLDDTDRSSFLEQIDTCTRSAVHIAHLNFTFVHRLGRLIQIRGSFRQIPELGPGTVAFVGTIVRDRVGDPSGLLDRYLKQAVESSTDWACIFDAERQEIAFIGKMLSANLGRQPKDLLGLKWRTLVHPQDVELLGHHLGECADNPFTQSDIEFRVRDCHGEWRWWSSRDRGFVAPVGMLPERRRQSFVLGTVRDITARKQAEIALHNRIQQEQLLRGIAEKIYESFDLDRILNASVEDVRHLLKADRVMLYRWEDDKGTILVESSCDTCPELLNDSDLQDDLDGEFFQQFARRKIHLISDIRQAELSAKCEDILVRMQVQSQAVVSIERDDRVWGLLSIQHCNQRWEWQPWEIEFLQQLSTQLAIAITQSQLYQRTQLQAQRVQALNRLVRVLRTSLNLNTVFSTAVKPIASELHLSGASIWQYVPECQVWQAMSAHCTADPDETLLGREISDRGSCRPLHDLERQQTLQFSADEAIARGIDPTIVACLPGQWLVVPLRINGRQWGCLILSDRSVPSQFTEANYVDIVLALAEQLEVAIQQSDLYTQVQTLNFDLERQIRSRTYQLKQALDLEEILKQITDKVRDSLDEEQILQTAVKELAIGLRVDCCESGLYSSDRREFTIAYEYTPNMVSARGHKERIDPSNRIHQALLAGDRVHFCPLDRRDVPRLDRADSSAILVCPIVDDREVLGNIWLFRPQARTFGDMEVRIVKQVATQCAIAIRQARLYKEAQLQVVKLEQLNQLKDDFLDTVSHELRTPITTMRMAIQMLGVALNQYLDLATDLKKPAAEQSRTARYYQILQQECDLEIRLIDDLLSLQRLEAEEETWDLERINLQSVLPQIVATFEERMRSCQQTFTMDVANDLPDISTDLAAFERILSELVHNAHKYTPQGHAIHLSASGTVDTLEIAITNTGVEIPAPAIDRVFDKFYRVPSADPWKQRGTGLGLALVKRLVERLQGTISVRSASNSTEFRVNLPFAQPSQTGMPVAS